MRMLVFCTVEEPTFMNSPLSSTRSRRAWVVSGSSATSSRNIVPPSASSKYPLRDDTAPVNAPFSWPNNSESIVPSGMAPQFTAIYLECLRGEPAWIIWGKNSLPEPLSPVTSTDRSIGATRNALCMAAIKAGALPMMPHRALACCTWADMSEIAVIFFCGVRKYWLSGIRRALCRCRRTP